MNADQSVQASGVDQIGPNDHADPAAPSLVLGEQQAGSLSGRASEPLGLAQVDDERAQGVGRGDAANGPQQMCPGQRGVLGLALHLDVPTATFALGEPPPGSTGHHLRAPTQRPRADR